MNEITMLDKLKVVFDISKSSVVFPLAILFLAFISFLFITTNKNNSKDSKKAYKVIYLIIVVVILAKYAKSISTMFDYMMNNVFVVLYFPNIAVYLIAIIITNIIMWISIFSTKTKKIIKIINSVFFSIIHYLFILLLGTITDKGINVFNQTALYSNKSIHSLIELSSNIFILWIVFLIIYKLVNTYIENRSMKQIESLSVQHIGYKPIQNSFSRYLKEVKAPVIVKRDTTPTNIVYKVPNNLSNTAMYEQMLTLDDYKLLVKLLKEEKDKEIKSVIKEQKKKVSSENIVENNISNSLSDLRNLYNRG